MYHVAAATRNPAKIGAISQAFNDVFGEGSCHIEGVSVDSGVSAQPISNAETRMGARQRVMNARFVRPEADFWVAIEAGTEEQQSFAWVVIENNHQRGESRSASLLLPDIVQQNIAQGQEMRDIMAQLTGEKNGHRKEGAIGILTNRLLTRRAVYYQALVLALCPFQHPIYQLKPDPALS